MRYYVDKPTATCRGRFVVFTKHQLIAKILRAVGVHANVRRNPKRPRRRSNRYRKPIK